MVSLGICYSDIPGKEYISFEIKKWQKVLQRLGFSVYLLRFLDSPFLKSRDLLSSFTHFVKDKRINVCIVEDLFSSEHSPLFIKSFVEIITEMKIRTIFHHHNLYITDIPLPKDKSYISHVVLNSIDQDKLFKEQGIRARVVPYMYDPDEIRPLKRNWKYLTLFMPNIPNMREDIAIVIKNKLESILEEKVELIKSTSLNDLLLSDIMIYPAFSQGWAPYLMEAIAGGIPVLISEYKVYRRDISPFEFDFISLGNMESEDVKKAINKLVNVISNEEIKNEMVSRNRDIAEGCFSLSMLKRYIEAIIGEF